MWLGEEARAPRSSSRRGARVGRPRRSSAPEMPDRGPPGVASARLSRSRRRRPDVSRCRAIVKSPSAKRPERASPRRARRWPRRATGAPGRWASAPRRGTGVRAARSRGARRAQRARRTHAKRRAQRSRKTSVEPVIRAKSRYLSRPSAMRRCRVATQFLGLSSRTRLKG